MPPDLIEKSREDLGWEVVRLRQENADLKRMLFGRKSERFAGEAEDGQLSLDLGAAAAQADVPEVEAETITYKRKASTSVKIHPGRAPLPAQLRRVDIVIEPEEDTTGLVCIGEEITEELEYKPGSFFVKRYRRRKYAKAGGEGVLIGTLVGRPIEKGIAGPGLLAQIIADKYVDHLPLYRQGKRYEREGVKIPDSTLGDWLKQSVHLLQPIYQAMIQQLLQSDYIQADETTIKVLDKDKKGSTHLGYYWVYRAPVTNIAVFEYQKGRAQVWPIEFLKNFKGDLQCDGYDGYENFESRPHINVLNCMAHARRPFEKALDNDRARAMFVLNKMKVLYAIEDEARQKNMDHNQRLALRQEKAIPVLEELHTWLQDNLVHTTPQSLIGKAFAYSIRRWHKLCRYTTDGKLEIDNNLIENAIRPVALGRKNYLFAGSHDSAQRAAVVYSILASCKIANINPVEYLTDVLARIAEHPINAIGEILPDKWKKVENV